MLYNAKVRFDFIKHRNKFFMFSVILTLIGILSVSIFHMNFGVDFKAGTNMDILVGKKLSQADAKEILGQAGYTDITPTVGGTNGDRVSARFDDVLDQPKVKAIEDAFKAKYGDKVSSEVNVVSPDIAQELGIKAIYAVIIASVAIMLYVMIRFEWRMALAANIAILYDAFVVVTIFSIFRLQVDLPFIAAVLTTIGYSINDKIVIFDRIRENLRFAKTKSSDQIGELVNQSLWQTMARNVYTVLAVLVIATCLFIFGGESIKLFALAKMIGLASGAYSSICIAAPLWMVMKSKQKPSTKAAAKKAV
ncbi:protein translocase subunit SecF [Paenibacillus glycanilyticus]|uniref:protein translocase subunit SecF n=1 Tax=Paenibacillus glycanilyticus TaxID=126569 RepID=UPI00203B2DEA|nr:protein translocase subunit SecF [Paenibacillus glycanilyticus]MCM3630121.1 protein translocase subunit SecF [Paenibacillus glycanilyticus]